AKALALVDALDKPGTPFKLALEIAGTQSLNMKGTLIARSGDSTHEVPLGSTARTDDHRRELIFENLAEGEYDLFLYQPDEKHGAYQIPLVQGFSTCSSEESSPRWQTALVPLLPRCYTTADADRTKAQYPRCSQDLGWLYVFVNGQLWRELKVEREGFFRDVNLTYEKGQDVRPATVQTSDSRVVVPYTIQGKAVALEMAYSEVQWSWARIDAMGGMAEDDPRQEQGGAIPPGVDSEEATKLRSRRLQKIDLFSYPDFDQDEGVIGPANQFEIPLRYDLAAFRQSKVPVVYLHDPIGIAKDLATEVFICKQNYLEGRNQAAEEAGTKNAMAEIVFQMGLDSPKAAALVDMDELRAIVQWDRQIAHLHALEDAAVVLGQFITSAPVEGCPDIHTVMKDYDEHPHVERLFQGHLLSSELVGHLIYGEGRQYLSTSLKQPDHFLVSALSPCSRKIEALGKNVDKAAEFFENMAAAAQIDPELEKKVFELFAKIVEQISDGEYILEHGNFNLAPVLAGSAATTAKGGYLSNSFTTVLRGRFDAAQWVVIKKGMSRQMDLTMGRSVEWLQKNQPLIKLNAVRFFAVLEVMNLGKAVAGVKKSKFGKADAKFAAALTTLISLGFTYLKDIKQIGAGWDNKELPRWQQHSLKRKRISVAGGAHGFGFIGNVIVVAQAWNDAWAESKKGHISGAVAAGVSALGTTILAAATTLGGVVEMNTLGASGFRGAQATRAARFGKTKVSLGRSLQASRVRSGTAAGLAIMLVGGALMFFFSRTPLEHFLARGPFGRDKENRYTGSREFECWRDDAIAEATLFNILFSPRLAPHILCQSFRQHVIVLKIHLPLIFEGKTRIDYTLFGLPPLRFGKPAEKKVISPRSEGELISNQDGSYTLTLAYDFEAIRDFATYEAQALVDLYGDGSRVLPIKIEHTALAGPIPTVVQFPEAVLS
ncbi:MAG: toxin VasX, partial [Desulfuromonadales bacterium]|nr:toxin VasX [Desulfuromonadales bacterium]